VPPPQSTSVSEAFFRPSLQVGVRQVPPRQVISVQSEWAAHVLPTAQLGQVPPPQSTSVSEPFFTASLQVGAWQRLFWHRLLWQSEPPRHSLLVAQRGQVPPPQSMSVSEPFFTPSLQVGTAVQTLFKQYAERQSGPLWQLLPLVQGRQLPPPQSMSDSLPFLMLSLHDGAAHWLLVHTWLTQSRGAKQLLPVAQAAHVPPPQSTSVSAPFFIMSMQLPPAEQRLFWQMLLTQSVVPWQAFPLPQRAHTGPPQSMSVSWLSLTPSLHEPLTHTLPAHSPVEQSLGTMHALPVTHLGHELPPQSTSVSAPFLTPSVQERMGVHTLFTHSVLAQSVPKAQLFPLAQCAHEGPPQSTSVSVPSLVPLLQNAAATHDPLLHSALWQSVPVEQPLPTPHWPQVGPPQSMSVSLPSLLPSVQKVAAAQVPPEQNRLWQSARPPQVLPFVQALQVGPPQSTSVSAPSLTPSAQLAVAVQRFELHSALTQSPAPEQVLPLAQRAHEEPPQSMSVSVPFLSPSLHVAAATQALLLHRLLEQSLAAAHALPLAQWGQLGPPQSTSVSAPFLAPSVQLGPDGVQTLLVHSVLTQSAPATHALPSEHLGQLGPPQSTSVSLPFLVLSEQLVLGAVQRLLLHRALEQSAAPLHALPVAHFGHAGPPQSMSVSEPSRVPLVQVAGGARQRLLVHRPELQSAPAPHALPLAHFGQALPPQSTSLSLPSFAPLLHEAIGRAQALLRQIAEAQSAAPVQALAAAHLGQVGPPQSTSVSAPFFAPSVQLLCWSAAQTPPAQWPVVQSPPLTHALPTAHARHAPPQSMSVSSAFFAPSVQVGGGRDEGQADSTSAPRSAQMRERDMSGGPSEDRSEKIADSARCDASAPAAAPKRPRPPTRTAISRASRCGTCDAHLEGVMSSDAPPKSRKKLQHKRVRRPARPARGQVEDVEGTAADTLPASETGSFIEPVTKDDPTASRQPSVQEEPPRLRGP
jgi:hypothetical protein